MQIIRCVLSGSFHGDKTLLERDYRELIMCGCQVLSPHVIEFIDKKQSFVRSDFEVNLSIREIETHHLTAIKQADFVWIHSSNGYFGLSTAMEIGFALALNKPIYSRAKVSQEVFQPYINIVDSVFSAIESISN